MFGLAWIRDATIKLILPKPYWSSSMNTVRIIGTLARLLLLLSVAGSVPAGAEIYRWTDERGKVHFGSQKPSGVNSGRVETFQGGANVSFVGGGGGGKAEETAAKVRMFTTQWCPVCKKAKAYLKKRGTSFEELDVEASRSAKAEFDRLGGKGVPVILVGKQRMDGFDPARMESMLADSGL
jgi:glutaredoxin